MNLLKTEKEKKRIDQGACLMIEIQAIIPSVSVLLGNNLLSSVY